MKILLVLGGGIGNIIQATPAFKILAKAGHIVDLKLNCNSTKDVQEIFNISAVRNVYVKENPPEKYDIQFNGPFTGGTRYKATKYMNTKVNYAQHKPEVGVYCDVANQLGIKYKKIPPVEINAGKSGPEPKHKGTVAIYPGSKPTWAMKRWDKYDKLSEKFDHVTLVGTPKDINSHGEPAWIERNWDWPKHVDIFHGTLRETAYYISKCKFFVGNDGGLAHVAAAVGIPTFVIFGPTSVIKNKPFSANAHEIAIDLPCRPCQFKSGNYFGEHKNNCAFNMKCMRDMSVDFVYKKIQTTI